VAVGGRELEVVPTPGHTQGHVVFHDTGHRLLFAGDHVLPRITPSIGFEPVPAANPLGDFLRSLAVVRARPDARLLPAHGPVADSVHARVDELTAHHGERLDRTEAAVRAGAGTGHEVAAMLTWTRRETALADLDPFNQMLAVMETGAHLDLLAAQGRLRVEADAGRVRRYSVV
jgi:glyoxylase-like metal-dependent hydrolase (beta-lactamase superfamily II)